MSPRKSPIPHVTYVALLRGINVGGKHRLPMQQLTEIFADAKCADIRTYIQSGNVIFTPRSTDLAELGASIASKIEQRCGFGCPVILRTKEQMAQAVRNNPFLRAGLPQRALHVYFLADLPAAGAIRDLDPARSTPDAFQVIDRQVYLHVPNGMARTKLTNAYFDSKLSTVSTARNWATVTTLLEMMQG